MLNKIKIPVAIQITIDDLGWHDGRDYTNIGKASRSGIPRDHVLTAKTFVINDDIYATMLFVDEY